MKNVICLVTVCMMAVVNFASADTFGTGDNAFTIDFVPISGSTNPTSGIPAGNGFTFTGVANDYRMGKFEITNDQWNKFKAAYGAVANSGGGDSFNPYWTGTDVSTNNVSWLEAAQFVNWLNTSKGYQSAYKFTGTIHTISYTLEVWGAQDADGTNLYRNKAAKYFLPTEDEWVKAAYWNGSNSTLQTYSNASAGDLVSGLPDPTKWNYPSSVGDEPWNATSGVQELNGTHNMMGNVWEWVESPYSSGYYLSSFTRGLRGGSHYGGTGDDLASSIRVGYNPGFEGYSFGFRVASVDVVPEPCTLLLLCLGGMMIRRK